MMMAFKLLGKKLKSWLEVIATNRWQWYSCYYIKLTADIDFFVTTWKPSRKKGDEQGSKSPFSLLSEPISPSSLLFEPISPSSLNVYLTFSLSSLLFPPISPSSQLFFGPFLPPPYSVPAPSILGKNAFNIGVSRKRRPRKQRPWKRRPCKQRFGFVFVSSLQFASIKCRFP